MTAATGDRTWEDRMTIHAVSQIELLPDTLAKDNYQSLCLFLMVDSFA